MDSHLTQIHRPSPNFGPRHPLLGRDLPDLVVLHYTGMISAKAALARLCDPRSLVSAHYLIDEDGTLYGLVAEDHRAWHAGKSCWEGISDVNSRSIGIELVNPGHGLGYRPFPAPQIDRLIALLHDIRQRHPIADWHLLGHSDVAPARKIDPGERFPWALLARHGLGLFPEIETLDPACNISVTDLQYDLMAFGYDLDPNGLYDHKTMQIVRAAQRHFTPDHITGVAQPELVAFLKALCYAKGQ
ncbi:MULTISPECIES: N-acetylmuramoyl-L-alanine amidase [unclassified Iodidimonas]|jgi:N-acetylmuramoyl-L-alanine amidase|uniref:N-acetylmuramoyl-L-alanine amidase n=1 Tax=unclassified Iodidimonas TaxID=2626145 RepID=UPI00248286C2|nr:MULTISPECIES: N-acetylmuramoyl-L-alanine amidase [unclassified Iodidimonas]